MQGPQANALENKKKIADCFFIDLKCAPKKSDIFSHIANWAEAYKKHSKRGIDIKQLNEESNPPIDIHITKRERERESAKILPAAAIPFAWPAAFYSLPEL